MRGHLDDEIRATLRAEWDREDQERQQAERDRLAGDVQAQASDIEPTTSDSVVDHQSERPV